jgi:hypothetical protein
MIDFIEEREELLIVHDVKGGLLRPTWNQSLFDVPVRILQSFNDRASIQLAPPRFSFNPEPSIR